MQLNLAFLEIPNRSETVWDQLDEQQRVVALEVLARLIAQIAQNELNVEGNDDD